MGDQCVDVRFETAFPASRLASSGSSGPMRRDAWPRAEKTLAFPSAADVARPLPKKQSLRRSALFAGSASNVPHLRIVHSHRAFAPTPCTTDAEIFRLAERRPVSLSSVPKGRSEEAYGAFRMSRAGMDDVVDFAGYRRQGNTLSNSQGQSTHLLGTSSGFSEHYQRGKKNKKRLARSKQSRGAKVLAKNSLHIGDQNGNVLLKYLLPYSLLKTT